MRKNARKRLHREIAAYLAAVDTFRVESCPPQYAAEGKS
jgi:hypothetical protein